MNLPPILAQTISIIPPELVQLGTVGIIAAALFGVVFAIRPLLSALANSYKDSASVNRELLRLRAAGELTAPQTPEELEARLNLIATDYNGYK